MKQKMKVLMMGILFTLFTQSAFAFDVYVGGAVGVGAYDGKSSVSSVLTAESYEAHHGGTSFVGGGLLGVEEIFCNGIYTAVELNALYNSYDTNVRNLNFGTGPLRAKVNNDFIYGADLKLGMDINCVLPYFVVGVSATRWQARVTNDSLVSEFGIAAGDSASFSKTRVGPKVGLGVRFAAWDCWDLDFQYSFTWYGKSSRTITDPTVTTDGTWTHSNRHDQHRFLVSLNMRFFSF